MKKILLSIGCLLLILPVVVVGQKKSSASRTQTKVTASKPNLSLSLTNRKVAKLGLDAVSEIQSVISVGASYNDYVRILQNSKIKYDQTMQDFVVKTEGDRVLLEEFEDLWLSYRDARVAWQLFVEHEDKYKNLDPDYSSALKPLANKYGFGFDMREVFVESPPFLSKKSVIHGKRLLEKSLR